MIRRLLMGVASLALVVASTTPAFAGCRGGTYVTFKNNTDYCVWATLYYSYVVQAGWHIEHAAEVRPHDTWMPWITFNHPDLGPQIGMRAEVMNYKQLPCKGSPNLADLRQNEDVGRAKINNEWRLTPREATITESNGTFHMSTALGPYRGGDMRCGF